MSILLLLRNAHACGNPQLLHDTTARYRLVEHDMHIIHGVSSTPFRSCNAYYAIYDKIKTPLYAEMQMRTLLNPGSLPIRPIVGYSRPRISRRPYVPQLRTTPDAPCRILSMARGSSPVCLPILGGSISPRDAHAVPSSRLMGWERLLGGLWMTSPERVNERPKMKCMGSSGSESGCGNTVWSIR